MNQAAVAISEMYRLTGNLFDRRFAVMIANIKTRMLEDVILAPDGLHADVDELLGDLSAAIIETQKTACQAADITDEQVRHFEGRLDNAVAEAVNIIRDTIERKQSRTSREFQIEAAQRLGLRVE